MYCSNCGNEMDDRAVVCTKCGVALQAGAVRSAPVAGADKKVAAGLCGILLGALGVHKFLLGYNTAGIIMLVVTIVTCGFGGMIMGVIGLIEGIIYLTKSDEDFVRTYIENKRDWF